MTFLIIFGFGVVLGMIVQKSSTAGKTPELSFNDGSNPIKIKTKGRQVFIEGPVESVSVNNQTLIEQQKNEKH